MAGFVGWITLDADAARADGGAAADRIAPGGRALVRAGGGAAAWLYAGPGSGTDVTGDAGGRIAAIEGAVRWTDPGLAARARADGPAAALLAAYGERGADALAAIAGPFAFALLDPDAGRAWLAIDRMGVRQLFHAETARTLLFATSLDALVALPAVRAEVTPQTVYRYAVNCVSPAPGTIYADCAKLLPGYALTWSSGMATPRRYWSLPQPADAGTAPAVLADQLRAHLDTAVERALARGGGDGDGDAGDSGAFLSGGLDSSTVAGLLARRSDRPAKAFTIGFAEARYDETPYAEIVARHFDLDHRVYRLSPADAADLVPAMAAASDEPFGNSSLIPAYHCARMAKAAGVSRLLAGDGGDELFAGNKRYVEQKLLGVFDRLPRPLRALLASGADVFPDPLAVSVIGKAQRYVRRARVPLPERMLESPAYARAALDRVFTPAALAAIDPGETADLWRRHYRETETTDPIHAMQRLDHRVTLADNDLRKVERAARMAGIEVAYPMLDEDLVTFAAGIPSTVLIQGLRLRAFFKDAVADLLPPAILTKPKHGFGMPFAEWTRTDPRLRALAGDCLSDLKRRDVFSPAFLDDVLDAHHKDRDPNLCGIVWDLMMLETWWQAHDAPAPARRVADANALGSAA